MSVAPATTPPPAHQAYGAPAPVTAADSRERILARLAQAGLNIALDLEAQIHGLTAMAPAPGDPPPHPLDLIDGHAGLQAARASADLALAFARVSRAVRLTLALAERLESAPAREPCAARTPAAEPSDAETLAETPGRDAERPCREDLFDRERLDTLLALPAGELIARLCADLGLPPDWPMLAAAAVPVTRLESTDSALNLLRKTLEDLLPSREKVDAKRPDDGAPGPVDPRPHDMPSRAPPQATGAPSTDLLRSPPSPARGEGPRIDWAPPTGSSETTQE
jgi:hypothetical protein